MHPDTPGAVLRRYGPGDLTPGALHQQLTAHARRPGFALVAAYDPGVLVGFGYAFPCTPAYWFGPELLPKIPEPARTTEHLVGLCELAVRPSWQDHGIGTRLHQALVDALTPRYVSLLAMPGNADSQRLYRRLGYTYAGPYRNAPGGAVFDLLLLEVPAPRL